MSSGYVRRRAIVRVNVRVNVCVSVFVIVNSSACVNYAGVDHTPPIPQRQRRRARYCCRMKTFRACLDEGALAEACLPHRVCLRRTREGSCRCWQQN